MFTFAIAMAEASPSTSRLVSTHENNISMLLTKLKELQMDTDSSKSHVFNRVEGEYW